MGKNKHKSGSDTSTVEEDIIEDYDIELHTKDKNLTMENPDETEPSTSKKHKRRKSQEDAMQVQHDDMMIKEEGSELVDPQQPVKPKKKKKVKLEPVKMESVNENHENDLNEFTTDVKEADNDEEDEIQIPAEHLPKLLMQIEKALPDNDTMMYLSRAKKLDWNEIAFYDYTADKCRDTWNLIQKRQRHYRLLSEVLKDSKEWVKRPWQNFNKGTKNKTIIHPDYPKKPLSSYMLFYLERRDPIMTDNPGIKMPELSRIIATQYNELPEDIKVTYLQLAASKRALFDQDVEEFYTKHPEVPRHERTNDRAGSKPPKKPPTPFIIFFEEQLKKTPGITDRAVFKEACKEKWKMLSEKKKMIWIEWAVRLENKYQEEMKEFLSNHPNYKIKDKKILTKEEKMLKEKMEGKPEKPPNSSYSLFCTVLLKSEEYKIYDAKERLKLIAAKWKTLPQAEKDKYKLQTQNLMEQYKQDYAAYLETLPDDKRADELNKPKRGAKTKILEEPQAKKVKTDIEEEEQEPDESTMDTAPMPKFENALKELVTPETWEDMSEREKAMYMKYIQKIKGYFDNQHRTASKYRETTTSDSESESSETE